MYSYVRDISRSQGLEIRNAHNAEVPKAKGSDTLAALATAGATLAAKVGAYSHGRVQLIAHATNATTAVGERYATTTALTAASTDTQGVGDRRQRRSKYGAKRPK